MEKAKRMALSSKRKEMVLEPDPITRLVRNCNPNEDLSPDDTRWVDLDGARDGGMIDWMARAIRRCDKPISLLFAGHRGIGKTTELRRLKAKLEASDKGRPPFHVIFVDATAYLDINDIDFPDLLAVLAGQVLTALREDGIPGFSTFSVYVKHVWDDFKSLLGSEVVLKEAEVEVPFGKVGLEFRNQPTRRQLLREKLESLTTDLLEASNKVLDEAQVQLQNQGKAGLVLIVDGLDKIVRRPLPNNSNTHDRLFIDRAEQLTGLRASTVYTVPISLLYTARHKILEDCFGVSNKPIPMIPLRDDRGASIAPKSKGMTKLMDLLKARCAAAGVTIKEAFETDDVHVKLREISGGHPRRLLALLCSAANRLDALPITKAALEQAIRDAVNSAQREVPEAYREKLKAFREPSDEMPNDDDHQEMLFLLWVFEYLDDKPWYEINPIVGMLEQSL